MSQLKVAVVGTNIGSTLHVRSLKAAGFAVTTLVGRNAERTKERAAHFNIPIAATSVEQATDGDIDAVVIATPPESHVPMALAAMKAGKHVLCEKPLALTADLARELRDAAAASGVVTALQHQQRWVPAHAMLRKQVGQGAFGELIQGSFTFDFPMTNRPQPLDVPDWWLTSETGGGWLRNWNSHGIDLVRYMIGEFAAVSGRVHPDLERGMSADDAYVFAFVLKNGMQGVMTGSCRSWVLDVQMRVLGSHATAVIEGSALVRYDKDGKSRVDADAEVLAALDPGIARDARPEEDLPPPDRSVYQEIHSHDGSYIEQTALCSAFKRRILDRGYRNPALATFDDGLAAMQVIEAVERSQREGKWIDV
jgi:predicted dehydrogenase